MSKSYYFSAKRLLQFELEEDIASSSTHSTHENCKFLASAFRIVQVCDNWWDISVISYD